MQWQSYERVAVEHTSWCGAVHLLYGILEIKTEGQTPEP